MNLPTFIQRRIAHRPNLQKALANTGWLFADRILRMGMGLLVGVWVARYLGPEQFGLFSYASAFVALFGAIATLGLNGIVVRDLVKEPDAANPTLGTAFVLQLIGGVSAFCLAVFTIHMIRPNDTVSILMVTVLGFSLVFKATETVKYWFESKVQSKYPVWVENAAFIIFVGVKVMLILSQAPLMAFVWVALAEAALVAMALLGVYVWQGGHILAWASHITRAKSLLKDSWPLILSGLSISLGMRVDQVMLNEMIGPTEVGLYSAGVRLAEPLVFVGIVIAQSTFPRLIELQGKAFEEKFIAIMRYPFLVITLFAIFIAISSSIIVRLLFGIAYQDSSNVLSILIFSIPITYISVMSTQYLLRAGHLKEIMRRQFLGLVINVVLNLLLINKYGIVGSAIATVVTDVYIAFLADIGRPKYTNLFTLKVKSILFIG